MGDRVFLKVSPWKGVLRFGRRGKLRPRYIEPYEIISRVGPVAYRLDLPPELSKVHNVFHVPMLRKYIPDPSHVLRDKPIELIQTPSTCEETRDRISLGRTALVSAWMDDLDPLLIWKQEPWYI